MTTLNLQVGYDADDVSVSGDGYFYISGFDEAGGGWLGDAGGVDLECGVRFRNVTIPPGSTVNSATMQLNTNADNSGTTWRLKIVGEAADNPGVWADPSHRPDTMAQTTAKVDWDPATWTAGWKTSPSIQTIIAEIVARGGWASGNALCLGIIDDGSSSDDNVQHYDYAAGSSTAAKLDIDYTAPAGGNLPEKMASYRRRRQ